MKIRAAVIGGGVSGLAAARAILKNMPGSDVKLFEKRDHFGGAVSTKREQGLILEGGPDSIITEKPAGLALIHELGLDDKLQHTSNDDRRAKVVCNGRLRPIPEGFRLLAPTRLWPFVLTPVISPLGKLRIGLDFLLPKRKETGDETLSGFVVRRLGREVLEKMAQPLIGGIYGGDPERLSLQATMPRFMELEKRHRSVILGLLHSMRKAPKAAKRSSGARYGLFVSLQGGLSVLTEALEKDIDKTCLCPNTDIRRFYPSEHGWIVEHDDIKEEFDCVVTAMPSWAQANLMDFDAELAAELRGVRYSSSAVVNIVFDTSSIQDKLDSFGFVVPRIENTVMMACTYASVKFAGRAPEGQIVLRCFCGGADKEKDVEVAPDVLTENVLRDLHKFIRIKGEPRYVWVAKHYKVMPQYEYGHLERLSRIARLTGKYKGLFLAGNGFDGVGVPDCARHAAETVAKMCELYRA